MAMPQQKRGASKQSYRTPTDFLLALRQFGSIGFDLACTEKNRVAPNGFTKRQNSLKQDWTRLGLLPGEIAFCNPPFANLSDWLEKASTTRWLARWTLMLVPYSGGALWWNKHVMGQGMVYGIPRLTFVGCKDPYPKDLALIAYGFGVAGFGFFDWRRPWVG